MALLSLLALVCGSCRFTRTTSGGGGGTSKLICRFLLGDVIPVGPLLLLLTLISVEENDDEGDPLPITRGEDEDGGGGINSSLTQGILVIRLLV